MINIIKSFRKIIKGIWNSIFGTTEIKSVAQYRQEICQSNKCGHYDRFGLSENAVLRGEPSCDICGCNIKFKTSVMEEECTLSEIGEEPLWYQENLEDEKE